MTWYSTSCMAVGCSIFQLHGPHFEAVRPIKYLAYYGNLVALHTLLLTFNTVQSLNNEAVISIVYPGYLADPTAVESGALLLTSIPASCGF